MSEFDGHLLEYPFISIDRFTKANFSSSVYFLSHYHLDHIEGLLDREFLNRLKCGLPSSKLYTSDATRNLMVSDPNATDILPYIIGLPVHQHTSISIQCKSKENVSSEDFVVTLISAGHCVGSVMFLFEGCKGAVLYTGDFRLGKDEISKVKCLHSGSQVIKLTSVYVDTTFLCPNTPDIPSRDESIECIIGIIKSWIKKGPQYVIHLKCKGKYGYEYIMKAVAKYFNTKIHVNQWRLQMSEKLPDMLSYFTTDKSITQIHCCYYGKKSTDSYYSLPCGLQHKHGQAVKMLTIVPSCLFFMTKGIPKEFKMYVPSKKLWRVVHSMHASYNEIREVVGYLRADNIFPFVPPVDCHDIWTAYQRLKDLRSLYSSSEEAESQQRNIEPLERDVSNTTWIENLRKKNDHSQRSGEHQHKDLCLSLRENLKSPPPKRKRKRKNIFDEFTVSSSKRQNEEKISDFDSEDELLCEAFGLDCDQASKDTVGFTVSDIVTEEEEKSPSKEVNCQLSNNTNIVPSGFCDSTNIIKPSKNPSNYRKLKCYDLENGPFDKNEKVVYSTSDVEISKYLGNCPHPEVNVCNTNDGLDTDIQGNNSLSNIIFSDDDIRSTLSDKAKKEERTPSKELNCDFDKTKKEGKTSSEELTCNIDKTKEEEKTSEEELTCNFDKTKKEENITLRDLTCDFDSVTNINLLDPCVSGKLVNICSSPNYTNLGSYDLQNYPLLSNEKAVDNTSDTEISHYLDNCPHAEIGNLDKNKGEDNFHDVIIISDGDSESTDSDKTLSLNGSLLGNSQEL